VLNSSAKETVSNSGLNGWGLRKCAHGAGGAAPLPSVFKDEKIILYKNILNTFWSEASPPPSDSWAFFSVMFLCQFFSVCFLATDRIRTLYWQSSVSHKTRHLAQISAL